MFLLKKIQHENSLRHLNEQFTSIQYEQNMVCGDRCGISSRKPRTIKLAYEQEVIKEDYRKLRD